MSHRGPEQSCKGTHGNSLGIAGLSDHGAEPRSAVVLPRAVPPAVDVRKEILSSSGQRLSSCWHPIIVFLVEKLLLKREGGAAE